MSSSDGEKEHSRHREDTFDHVSSHAEAHETWTFTRVVAVAALCIAYVGTYHAVSSPILNTSV